MWDAMHLEVVKLELVLKVARKRNGAWMGHKMSMNMGELSNHVSIKAITCCL
jgi:hypothetical protein